MEYKAIIWLLCNLFSIVVLAFYSMLEMACVSFNKVRLQYYVSKGNKRAIWLNYLLQNPSRLFGTTLIGVNIALVVGSECSREFHSAIGINPDFAPFTQVILVVIFGELAPMFAARHYAEHVVMLGVPLIYASARLMAPFLWCLGAVSKIFNSMLGGQNIETYEYLNQEELQKIIEQQSDEQPSELENQEFNAITANIFALRGKNVRQVMQPLRQSPALPSNATVAHFETLLKKSNPAYILIYQHDISNIVGIAYPRDLLRAAETRRVRDYARPPWFITETISMMQILKQFRKNKENVAVVLNQQGKAIGLVALDDILEEIFGEFPYVLPTGLATKKAQIMLIEKTFSGDATVGDIKARFDVSLDPDPAKTLSDIIIEHLGHRPEKGESIYIAPFELTVKEATLREVKTVAISTRLQ